MNQIKPNFAVIRQDNIPYYTLTPRSLTLCLAYVQRHLPRRLSGRRLLAPGHLARLAQWIEQPAPGIRSISSHPTLAEHLTLLIAADLLAVSGPNLRTSRSVIGWLSLSPPDQIDHLLQTIQQREIWQTTVGDLGWENILMLEKVAYLKQMLACQRDAPPAAGRPALCRVNPDSEAWELTLPEGLSIQLLFHLLQLGEYGPRGRMRLTPLSIAGHPLHHRGYDHIRWLLESATQAPLPLAQQQQLRSWLRRAHAYRIRGSLLSVARPEQLQAIWQNRRLRPYIQEQISPRHTLIDRALIPKLRRWLARQGYPLNQSPTPAAPSSRPISAGEGNLDLSSHWFSLRLLLGLQKYLRLPHPAPAAQLFHLEQTLPPDTTAELERQAQHTLQQLDDVIHGRDAFFPAYQSPAPHLINTIEKAIVAGGKLHIAYRAAGQDEARWHKIEPLRLETRAALTYLHAYSYRADANRTFRLDRITALGENG